MGYTKQLMLSVIDLMRANTDPDYIKLYLSITLHLAPGDPKIDQYYDQILTQYQESIKGSN